MAAAATGAADTVIRANVLGLETWDKAREGFREDAPFEELGKGELRGGTSERDISRVAAVAWALCITKVFMQLEWDCAPKGVFGKTQLQKLRDRELRGGISCGKAQWRSLCV